MAGLINIAFSGGVESVYMLQMAMEQGHSVNIVYINASGNPLHCIGELMNLQKVLAYFRDPVNKKRYPGTIKEVFYFLSKAHNNIVNGSTWREREGGLVTVDITQQWTVTLAMMKVRQTMLSGRYPTTFIGWIYEDSSDVSYDEMDFSAAEYKRLLELPAELGKLNNSDKMAKPFRAPLWELAKKDIWLKIEPDLKEFVILNGSAHIDRKKNVIIHIPLINKAEEYELAGIPCEATYEFPLDDSDFCFLLKRFAQELFPDDVGLPPDAIRLVNWVQGNYMMDIRQAFYYESDIVGYKNKFIRNLKEYYRSARLFQWAEVDEENKELSNV